MADEACTDAAGTTDSCTTSVWDSGMFDPIETLRQLQNVNGIDYLKNYSDGIGLHFYPTAIDPSTINNQVLSIFSLLPNTYPFWITEWGFHQAAFAASNCSFNSSAVCPDRYEAISAYLNAVNSTPSSSPGVAGLYYYVFGQENSSPANPDAWSLTYYINPNTIGLLGESRFLKDYSWTVPAPPAAACTAPTPCGSPGSCYAKDTCGFCNSSGPTSCPYGCNGDACAAAPVQKINGSCGSTNDSCSSGSPIGANGDGTSYSTAHTWTCQGSGGGTSAFCSWYWETNNSPSTCSPAGNGVCLDNKISKSTCHVLYGGSNVQCHGTAGYYLNNSVISYTWTYSDACASAPNSGNIMQTRVCSDSSIGGCPSTSCPNGWCNVYSTFTVNTGSACSYPNGTNYGWTTSRCPIGGGTLYTCNTTNLGSGQYVGQCYSGYMNRYYNQGGSFVVNPGKADDKQPSC